MNLEMVGWLCLCLYECLVLRFHTSDELLCSLVLHHVHIGGKKSLQLTKT